MFIRCFLRFSILLGILGKVVISFDCSTLNAWTLESKNGTKCYFTNQTSLNWSEAASFCQNLNIGGYREWMLVTPRNFEEDSFLRNKLATYGDISKWWLGQNDKIEELAFKNIDDSDACPGVFLDWQLGTEQPNGNARSEQDCIVFDSKESGTPGAFQDKACTANYGTLCKTVTTDSSITCTTLHADAFWNPANPQACYITEDTATGSSGTKRTFANAVAFCKELKIGRVTWHVPDIMTQVEADFLEDTSASANTLNFAGRGFYWAGQNDIAEEHAWEYLNPAEGCSPVYLDWVPGQPDGVANDEDCVALTLSASDEGFTDENCADRLFTICEILISPSVNPEVVTNQKMTTNADQTSPKQTSSVATTQKITTKETTTEGLTSEEMTSEVMTSEGLTTEGMTTKGMTTEGMTTKGMTIEGMTSKGMTTQEMTSKGKTTTIETTSSKVTTGQTSRMTTAAPLDTTSYSLVCDNNPCHPDALCVPLGNGTTSCFCPSPEIAGEFCDKNETSRTLRMGLQSGDILDSQLSASSFQPPHDSSQSRLNVGSGWIPGSTDTDSWISVTFLENSNITGFVIDGKFESFSLSFDGYEKLPFFDENMDQIFADLKEPYENERHLEAFVVDEHIQASSITFYPAPESEVNMTMEIFGFIPPILCDTNVCQNDGVCLRYGPEPECLCPMPQWGGKLCDEGITDQTKPLGMQSNDILDSQLSASSQDATQSRLNIGPGWIPDASDTNPWMTVDFMKMAQIMGLVVVGRFSTFSLSYTGVVQETATNNSIRGFFADPDPQYTSGRILIAVLDVALQTSSIKLLLEPFRDTNLTIDILGYFPPNPIEMLCLSNCLDVVTPTSILSVRAVFGGSTGFGNSSNKSYEWTLAVMDSAGVYHGVEDLSTMTITGVNRDVIALKENVLDPERTYRLRVNVFLNDYGNYMEFQYYEFTTNTPPSLEGSSLTPSTGYAALTTFNVSCNAQGDEESGFTYQFSSRYPGQDIGSERQLTETNSCDNVVLYLPVGNITVNYTLEVVIRVYDSYGGSAETVIRVQVFFPDIANSTILLQYLELLSGSVHQRLQNLNVLLSIVNALSYQSRLTGGGNTSGNGTGDGFGDAAGNSAASLAIRTQLRTLLIDALNHFAKEVNTTLGAKLLITAMHYATEIEEELTFSSLISMIPTLQTAIDILYELTYDAGSGDGSGDGTGTQTGSGSGSGDGTGSGSGNGTGSGSGNGTDYGNCTGNCTGNYTGSGTVPTIYNRQFSFGVLSLLHFINIVVVDVNIQHVCSETSPSVVQPKNNSYNIQNKTTEEISLMANKLNEILEYLESMVISNVLMTMWPGEQPQIHLTLFAVMTFYTTAETDRRFTLEEEQGQSYGTYIDSSVRITASFLSFAHSDSVIGISIVSRTRNPYPDSCLMTPVQSLEMRNERGQIISIDGAGVNMDVGFKRDTAEKAPERRESFPMDLEMILISFLLDKPGASAAEVVIQSDFQEGTCIQVYSRKRHSPSINRYDQYLMFRADGNQHKILFTDLQIGVPSKPPRHHLGIKVVKCGISNTTFELVMTSSVVQSLVPVNLTFETYVHTCVFWELTDKKWSGKGCKVSSSSSSTTTICTCNHMTSFASSFYVPVNKIDFRYVFANANLAENHTVFTTVLCLLAFYILLMIWLRKKDKDDLLRWSAHPLVDNQHGHGYFYTVSVHTGFATNAGTRSTVRFDMVGDRGNTGQRLLCDSDGFLHFDDGTLNHYVLKLPRSVGALQSLLIWHDNTGEAGFANWYLDWVLISDLQTGEKWAFICADWLATDKGEGKIFRSLKPAEEEEAAKIQTDFFRILRGTFADDNLWVSLFTRPTPSSFTRVQRLSVCLTFLFLFMIANAMFYRTDDEQEKMPKGKTARLGPFEIDFQQVYIGTISILIVMPVNLILVALFKSVQMSYEGHEGLAIITTGSDSQKRFKQGCRAPPIMKYLAWTLVFISIVLSAFFVIMYSLMWGHEKSKAWLMSMLTSFLESLLILEPVKAVCAAIIILTIYKCTKKAKFYEPDTVVYQDELASAKDAAVQGKNANNVVDQNVEAWQKKTATASLFRQIVSHVVFVVITILIILQHRDLDSYYMNQTVHNIFLGAEEEFNEIRSAEGFWEWTNDILIPAVFPTDSLPIVNDDRIVETGTLFLTGPVRFRQLRVQSDERCINSDFGKKIGVPCRPGYSYSVEETGKFGKKWTNPTNETCSNTKEKYCPWNYYSSYSLSNPTFYGSTGLTYAGGGFVAEWDFTADNAINITRYLQESNWLDEFSRAVFVEFALYNANINLFSYITYLVEFSPIGSAEPFPVVETFRLYDYTSSEDIQAITITLTYVLFVLTLLYFVIREIDDMKRSGKKYLLSAGNWLEICIIVSSISVLLAYMVRKVAAETTSRALQDAQETGEYVNFHPIAVMDHAYSIILGMAGFLSTLKVNILLSFDKRFTQLKRTMVYASIDLLAFGIFFSVFLFAFVAVNFLVLGPEIEDYNGVVKTTQTLLVLLLGQFRVHRFSSAMRFFSLTFFVIYSVVIGFILCRIFVAIICDAFTETRKEDAEGKEGVALEKVIGTELKRYFKELFSFRGKRKDAYKFKPTDELGTVRIDVPEVKVAWGEYDAPPLPPKTPPPAYDSIWNQQMDYGYVDRNGLSSSPDPMGIDLMLARAMDSLDKMSKTIENI